jgi:hypothetical protein
MSIGRLRMLLHRRAWRIVHLLRLLELVERGRSRIHAQEFHLLR